MPRSKGINAANRPAVTPSGRLSRVRAATGGSSFGYLSVAPALVVAAIGCTTAHGAYMGFGSMQGGRGVSISLRDGDDAQRWYCTDADEFAAVVEDIIEAYRGDLAEDIPALVGVGKSSRPVPQSGVAGRS